MGIPPFEPAHRDESNGGIFILLRPLGAEIFEWRSDKNADLMTFRRISRCPVVIEEWEYPHSIRLDEPVRMVVFSFFYDHWTPSYSTKRQMAQYQSDKNADLITFRRISLRTVVVEEWKYHHSTRLDELVRMVVFSFFYEHWTPRYSTKRQMAQ